MARVASPPATRKSAVKLLVAECRGDPRQRVAHVAAQVLPQIERPPDQQLGRGFQVLPALVEERPSLAQALHGEAQPIGQGNPFLDEDIGKAGIQEIDVAGRIALERTIHRRFEQLEPQLALEERAIQPAPGSQLVLGNGPQAVERRAQANHPLHLRRLADVVEALVARMEAEPGGGDRRLVLQRLDLFVDQVVQASVRVVALGHRRGQGVGRRSSIATSRLPRRRPAAGIRQQRATAWGRYFC